MIEFKNISKQYENNNALNNLNLTIPTGELFVLVGPSGSGKTTTLKMINRLIEPSNGSVEIDGKNIANLNIQNIRLNMGYILQNIALFPNLTIQDNIAIQLEAKRVAKKDRLNQAKSLLNVVNLDADKYATRYPHELSGGEQQRVGIIRALSTHPNIILMDEPFSALDPISRKQLQDLVITLHEQYKITFVFVTHDMQEALRLGTHIAVMKNGVIQQIGTPDEIVNHPANDFVKEFFNSVNNDKLKINELILNGYDRPVESNQRYGCLPSDASLSELSQALKGNVDGVQVIDNTGQKRVIKITDLLSFISERGV